MRKITSLGEIYNDEEVFLPMTAALAALVIRYGDSAFIVSTAYPTGAGSPAHPLNNAAG